MYKKKTLVLAVTLALALPGYAAEEEQVKEKENDTALEVISVTATKRKTKLMETPVAISAFSQDKLDQAGIKNVADMANLVPGLDISVSNEQSAPMISMRGIRSTNITELGDPAVSVHLDGIYSPRMQGALALMYDVERVEAMRGPQGTLFGRNSTVGNINVVSAKPKFDKFSASIDAEAGRFNSKVLGGMVNIPVNDQFAIRISGKGNKRDSHIDGYYDPNQYDTRHLPEGVLDAPVISESSYFSAEDIPGTTITQRENWWIGNAGTDPEAQKVRALTPADKKDFYGNANEYSFRVSALWEDLDAGFSNHTVIQKYKNSSGGGVDLVDCDKLRGRSTDLGGDCSDFFPNDNTYQAVVNVPGKLELDITYARNTLNYELTDEMDLVWLLGYEDMKRESAQDIEAGLDAWDGAMFFLDGTGATSYSTELQLQSDESSDLIWIVGANLFHEKTTTLGYYDNPMGDKVFWDQPDRSTDALSLFGQATYKLTDKLDFTLGYRFSDETKEDKGGRSLNCNTDNDCQLAWLTRTELSELPVDYYANKEIYPEYFNNENKGSWTHHDFRVGLDYDLTPDTMLYTYLASGFKAGGIGDVFEAHNDRTGETQRYVTQFDPEEVITWEAGIKTSLFDDSMNLQGTFFYTDYENMHYASVGSIGNVERWGNVKDEQGNTIIDENGDPVLGWINQEVVAYYTQNVPGSTIKGIELEFDWAPYAGGRLNGYATWTHAKVTEDWITKWDYDPEYLFNLSYEDSVNPENTTLVTNLKGNDLAVTPRFTVSLNYSQSFDLNSFGWIHWWTGVTWKDKSYNTVWNLDKHHDDMDFVISEEDTRYMDDTKDAHTMVHSSLKYVPNGEAWYLEAFINNATNETIQTWSNTQKGKPKGSFNMPRTWGARVGFKF